VRRGDVDAPSWLLDGGVLSPPERLPFARGITSGGPLDTELDKGVVRDGDVPEVPKPRPRHPPLPLPLKKNADPNHSPSESTSLKGAH